MYNSTIELLNALLGSKNPTREDIDWLISEEISEDLFLDYKDGRILDDARKARRIVRKYLSAFANSSGGILIIGINNQEWTISTRSAPGGGDLAEWAARAISQIAYQFSPPPRFFVVSHPEGEILICVTDRSLSPVYCREAEKSVFYLRNHDETFMAPDYLIQDIVLGRRNFPELRIGSLEAFFGMNLDSERQLLNLEIDLNIFVENRGMFWADEVVVIVVGWSLSKETKLSAHLLSGLEIKQVDFSVLRIPDPPKEVNIQMFTSRPVPVLTPYSTNRFPIRGVVTPIRTGGAFALYDWSGGICLLSRDVPPVWYQLQILLSDVLYSKIPKSHKLFDSEGLHFSYRRTVGNLPIVGWENMRESLM